MRSYKSLEKSPYLRPAYCTNCCRRMFVFALRKYHNEKQQHIKFSRLISIERYQFQQVLVVLQLLLMQFVRTGVPNEKPQKATPHGNSKRRVTILFSDLPNCTSSKLLTFRLIKKYTLVFFRVHSFRTSTYCQKIN